MKWSILSLAFSPQPRVDFSKIMNRWHCFIFLFFIVLALLFTWPLALHVHNCVAGTPLEARDPLLNTWILSWDGHAMLHSPTGLFQANIMYPAGDVLAYSENMLGLGMVALPLRAVTGNPILAYNLILLAGVALSGVAAWTLAFYLTRNRWASLAAGVIFAFSPYHTSQLSHLHISFLPLLPAGLLSLHRYLEVPEGKRLALFSLILLLQGLVSWHGLVFLALSSLLLVAWNLVFFRLPLRRLGLLLLAFLLPALLLLPLALPYLRAGFRWGEEELISYAPSLKNFFQVSDRSAFFGQWGVLEKGLPGSEGILFPGAVALIFSLLALAWRASGKSRNGFRRVNLYYLTLGAFGLVLSLGPRTESGFSLPLHYLRIIPLFSFIRVPTRFFILATLSLSILASLGIAEMISRVESRRGSRKTLLSTILFVIILILVIECATFSLPMVSVPVWGNVSQAFRMANSEEKALVAPLPRLAPLHVYDDALYMIPEDAQDYYLTEAMNVYLSTYSWRKMVNGYTGFIPQSYLKMVLELGGFPSGRSLRLLRAAGIGYIIWDRNREGDLPSPLVGELRLVFEDEGYQVWQLSPDSQPPRVEDLSFTLLAPSAAPAHGHITVGLMITNSHRTAFFSPTVKIQCILEWMGEGSTPQPIEQDLELPVFIDSQESVSLRFPVRVPGEGRWRLRAKANILRTVKDIVSEPIYIFDHVPDSRDLEYLAGDIRCDQLDLATHPSSMIYLPAVISNQGPSLWLARSPEYAGTMLVLARWYQGEKEVWEAQGSHLPCDLGPGQQLLAPLLLRAPVEEGSYELRLDLLDEGVGIITPSSVILRIRVQPQLGL